MVLILFEENILEILLIKITMQLVMLLVPVQETHTAIAKIFHRK